MNNGLSDIPQEIQRCAKLERLYLHRNPELGIPPEILGPILAENNLLGAADPKAILDYYFARKYSGGKPLNEVKLVLVGRGGSGKTSLVNRLTLNTFVPDSKETTGVSLCDWNMNSCPSGPVTAHIWDFAGQTITHAMHQFFLSVRSIYLLLLTGRENSERDDAEYWLRLIAAFATDESGKGPPVIVLLNKWDDSGSARPRIDRRMLKERYPFILGFQETDCKTGCGIATLKETLNRTVDTLGWVRVPFPDVYARVKKRLIEHQEKHLSYDEYRKICRECGVMVRDRQDILAENLHALGVALNFRKDARLRFASVLKPQWLTSHVYALLRYSEQNAGVLFRTGLPNALRTETEPRMWQFLIDMMVRFELAYPIEEENPITMAWLIPQALPDTQPDGVEDLSTSQDATRLRFSYRALPVSIMARFIVRTHPLIDKDLRWASGVVLTLNAARALVRADYTDKHVEVFVTGKSEARRELSGLIQSEMRFINGQMRGLDALEELQTIGEWVPTKTLESDELKHRKTGIATSKGTVEVEPEKKLNEFSMLAARDGSWKPRLFIAYAHQDEAQRRTLELYLKVLVTHGVIFEIWTDRKIQPGENWDRSIKTELEVADVMIFLISSHSLASDYIRTVEMKRALEREATGGLKLVPIILEDCEWKLPFFSQLQALPRNRKPVKEWAPQLKGWMSVSEGLKSLFQELQRNRDSET